MKMMKFATVMTVFSALLVSGCAIGPRPRPQPVIDSHTKALMAFRPDSDCERSFVIIVPSADDAASNAMMLARIKNGEQTQSVKTLSGILKKGSDKPIIITGEHDGMTAATIDSAMDSLKGARSTVRLFFIGDINYGPALKKKADALGIQFEVVPYPPAVSTPDLNAVSKNSKP